MSLDVGTCIDSMDTFLTVAGLAGRLNLWRYLEPDDMPTLVKPLFLFMDQSKLHALISNNRAGSRATDLLNADIDKLVADLGYNHFEEVELFSQQDTDIKATQELMVRIISGNPVDDF